MKQKEDPNFEKECADWVALVLGEPLQGTTLYESLCDGQALCRVVNVLKPGAIPVFNRFDPQTAHAGTVALAAAGNIRLYLAAVQQLGVPGLDLFLVDDLRTGRGMPIVCRNIASLSRVAARDLGWKVCAVWHYFVPCK